MVVCRRKDNSGREEGMRVLEVRELLDVISHQVDDRQM